MISLRIINIRICIHVLNDKYIHHQWFEALKEILIKEVKF